MNQQWLEKKMLFILFKNCHETFYMLLSLWYIDQVRGSRYLSWMSRDTVFNLSDSEIPNYWFISDCQKEFCFWKLFTFFAVETGRNDARGRVITNFLDQNYYSHLPPN